jgi:hypothetical protein
VFEVTMVAPVAPRSSNSHSRLTYFAYVAVYGTASTSADALCTSRVIVVKRKKLRLSRLARNGRHPSKPAPDKAECAGGIRNTAKAPFPTVEFFERGIQIGGVIRTSFSGTGFPFLLYI